MKNESLMKLLEEILVKVWKERFYGTITLQVKEGVVTYIHENKGYKVE